MKIDSKDYLAWSRWLVHCMDAKQRLAYAIFAAELVLLEYGADKLVAMSVDAARKVYKRNTKANREKADYAAGCAFHAARGVSGKLHYAAGVAMSAAMLAKDIYASDARITTNNVVVFVEALDRNDLLSKIIGYGRSLLEKNHEN